MHTHTAHTRTHAHTQTHSHTHTHTRAHTHTRTHTHTPNQRALSHQASFKVHRVQRQTREQHKGDITKLWPRMRTRAAVVLLNHCVQPRVCRVALGLSNDTPTCSVFSEHYEGPALSVSVSLCRSAIVSQSRSHCVPVHPCTSASCNPNPNRNPGPGTSDATRLGHSGSWIQ